jgi:hypothetical protein
MNAITIIDENRTKLAEAIENNKEIIKFNSNLKDKFVENFLELGIQQYLLSQVDINALVKLCIDLTKVGFNINPFKKEVYIIPFEVKINKETKIKVPAPVIPQKGWKKFYARAGFILDVQKIWKLNEKVAKKRVRDELHRACKHKRDRGKV